MRRDKVLTREATRADLENIPLSERSQTPNPQAAGFHLHAGSGRGESQGPERGRAGGGLGRRGWGGCC